MRKKISLSHQLFSWKVLLALSFIVYFVSFALSQHLKNLFLDQQSLIIRDRNGKEMAILPNTKGLFARRANALPAFFKEALIKKEDRFFYYHPGVNPFSMARSIAQFPFVGKFEGSSTLTQQAVKNILGNEGKRTIKNKIVEGVYALSLELHTKKEEVLMWYADTAYFGNRAQGINEASHTYFNSIPESLTQEQILELVSALSNPSDYPGTSQNRKKAFMLGTRLGIPAIGQETETQQIPFHNEYRRTSKNFFELSSLDLCEDAKNQKKGCVLTVDDTITDRIREILRTNLDSASFASVKNGATVVILTDRRKKENELLAIVGSPHPELQEAGYQINMAIRPRPIGSTAKPFIYAKAFERGVRPYTLVEDAEYRFDIGTGFPLYPKNYDGRYRGEVTLLEALANSLNVPAVRVLQFAGLDSLYSLLKNGLNFRSLQTLEQYELSIALGGLEMDPLTLAEYFTIFPNEGVAKPLRGSEEKIVALPMADILQEKQVLSSDHVALVNKILSDREAGAEQFGLAGNLYLPAKNYAVKTGTSYDYHDSWAIGYTPDFLVAVWLGNSDNKPMHQISGSVGAGKIWNEVMGLMLNSPYNKQTLLRFEQIHEFVREGKLSYGLAGDNYEEAKNLLKTANLILSPHDADVFQFSPEIKVPLRARERAVWHVNNAFLDANEEVMWHPETSGTYMITAKSLDGKRGAIRITITNEER